MNISDIIYNTCRFIHGVDDKLSIATLFLFCYKIDTKLFSELLYTSDHKGFIHKLQCKYSSYNVDFTVKLDNKDVRSSFESTIKEVVLKYDSNGYYKAVFDKDPFAMAIIDISNIIFNINEFKKEVGQLKINI